MDERKLIGEAYRKMYDGMVMKDEALLREVLDESYVLVHMTGMHQSKEAFIAAVMDGTLNYYSSRQESLSVELHGETAVMTGRSEVAAAVFGGRTHTWRLQQKCSLRKVHGAWKITRSAVSTY